MSTEKSVGGLKCSEVLERLSDYLDAELAAEERVKVEAHLAGCDACTRFGGEFGAVVTALRARLGRNDDAPPGP
ncbi:MAG: zf-HC2 domain-containing protein [Myxococcus sp.]|nr:zf-HC2 domain-containing protein [Myxococcus sp.]